MGGGDHPRLLRTGASDAELPDSPFHTKSKNTPLPQRLCWGTRSLRKMREWHSCLPSHSGALTWQHSLLMLGASPSPVHPNSHKFRVFLVGRAAPPGRACEALSGAGAVAVGSSRGRRCALSRGSQPRPTTLAFSSSSPPRLSALTHTPGSRPQLSAPAHSPGSRPLTLGPDSHPRLTAPALGPAVSTKADLVISA